jgi:HJR/Mrr/RecB family endonuclease
LSKRFAAVTFKRTVSISELQKDKQYRITYAVRVNTKLGQSIVVTVDEANNGYRVYLPNRYFSVLTDKDIQEINQEKIYYSCMKEIARKVERTIFP